MGVRSPFRQHRFQIVQTPRFIRLDIAKLPLELFLKGAFHVPTAEDLVLAGDGGRAPRQPAESGPGGRRLSSPSGRKGCPTAFVKGSDTVTGGRYGRKTGSPLGRAESEVRGVKTREIRLPRTNRWRLAGFYLHPRQGGLGGVTFYPDPDHTWDGGTQEGRES